MIDNSRLLNARELSRPQPGVSIDWMSILALAGGLLLWEAIGWLLDFAFLPPFSRVVQTSLRMILEGTIVASLTASLSGLALGYGFAAAGGVLLGTLMGRFPPIEHFFDVYIQAFLAAPTLIYVPILFALFGISRASQIAVVFLYAFFIITMNTMAGVRKVNPEWIEMARSFGASEWHLFWAIMLPASLPLVLSGLRTGLGRAVKGMINGEMFIALIGLGALIRRYGGRFDAERVLGILIVVIAMALLLTFLFGIVERRLLKWANQ